MHGQGGKEAARGQGKVGVGGRLNGPYSNKKTTTKKTTNPKKTLIPPKQQQNLTQKKTSTTKSSTGPKTIEVQDDTDDDSLAIRNFVREENNE